MGNCQAVDNASLVIQHPNGRVDKHYFPVSAAEIMKINPGHYVALLLLTTTLYSSKQPSQATTTNAPLRVTRIKLLRPTDTLLLGHVYRLVTSQEVMKGLWAKKQAKMKNGNVTEKNTSSSDCEALAKKKDDVKKKNNQERQRSRSKTQVNSATSKSRAWQPALKSISEAGT
ncbi:hypothetical protein SASPL_115685 [Salvia splendens]|uniref:DUF4228 domain protein n=1 Tax=Salvia splendens TaxID=180675 RepID=A0A8X8Y3M6_SALSN|nr:uncharacterized protein LOC121802727 [Salvia splendens]KAG6425258.1 hypothetical protein SASPL_115685 [Salvia splendens]